jgi:uncharacterized protein YybS (DUF2232 family)
MSDFDPNIDPNNPSPPQKESNSQAARASERDTDEHLTLDKVEAAASEEADWTDIENLEVDDRDRGNSTLAAQPTLRLVDPLDPLIMVETAFLASTSGLLWLVDYYFPMGPVLRIFFPVPIAMVYMRRGKRAAWMATLVSGLLLTVLMGPTRSVLFLMPYGVMGVLLGMVWSRGAGWGLSIGLGTIVGTFGFFFRLWLVSILLGDDLWLYLTTQVTKLAEWIFLRLGLLTQPSLSVVQAIAFVMVIINNLVYLFVVHLAAKLVLERLGMPIPQPPRWVQVLLEEE